MLRRKLERQNTNLRCHGSRGHPWDFPNGYWTTVDESASMVWAVALIDKRYLETCYGIPKFGRRQADKSQGSRTPRRRLLALLHFLSQRSDAPRLAPLVFFQPLLESIFHPPKHLTSSSRGFTPKSKWVATTVKVRQIQNRVPIHMVTFANT